MMPASASREMTASMHTYLVRARRTGSIAGRLSQKGPPGKERQLTVAPAGIELYRGCARQTRHARKLLKVASCYEGPEGRTIL